MKTPVCLILFSFLSLASFAQTSVADDYYIGSKPKKKIEDHVSGSVMVGTSVSFINSNTAMMSFVAPKLNYKLTDKLSLNIGFIKYSLTPGSPNSSYGSDGCFRMANQNSSGNLIFAGADYTLNKKLSATGSVMIDSRNNKNYANNFKAVSFGMDYKVSKNASIGFRTIISEGASNSMLDPMRGSRGGLNNYNSFSDPFSPFGGWNDNSGIYNSTR